MNRQGPGKGKKAKNCHSCARDCSLKTGCDHSEFDPHFHKIGPKAFVCVSWTDNPKEDMTETEDGRFLSALGEIFPQREFPKVKST